jgi:hypothetical protein
VGPHPYERLAMVRSRQRGRDDARMGEEDGCFGEQLGIRRLLHRVVPRLAWVLHGRRSLECGPRRDEKRRPTGGPRAKEIPGFKLT